MVFFAVLSPLSLKVGAAAPPGSVVAAQVYVRLPSPVSTSAPSTERPLVVPVAGLGVVIVAATATVGAWSVTVTELLPLIVPPPASGSRPSPCP